MACSSENPPPPPLSTLLQSEPKQFIAERAVFHVLLENGESYIFKVETPEDPGNERDAYIPRAKLEIYNKFKHLQGKHIPICYGIATVGREAGLVLENCGVRNLEQPPQDNENAKFIIHMRAMCAMERCIAAGLVHQDADFRNLVYDPVTLKVRIIDFDMQQYSNEKPQDV